MDPMDVACESSCPSVTEERTDEAIENRLLRKESLSSASKRKMLDMVENIEAAETDFESTKAKWNKYINSGRLNGTYSKSRSSVSPSRSGSSAGSFKMTSSEQPRSDYYYNSRDQDDSTLQDASSGNCVDVVLTPRSLLNHGLDIRDVPALEIEQICSLETIQASKRSKKSSKTRKKPCVNEPTPRGTATPPPSLMGKRRRFNARLRNSHSKSTVTTRDTCFSDKRADRKKFKKQKSLDAISVFRGQSRKRANPLKARESKQLNSTKECVEIYHNSALKTESLSLVSGRQSKVASRKSPRKPVAPQSSGDGNARRNVRSNEVALSPIDPRRVACDDKNETDDSDVNDAADQCQTSQGQADMSSPQVYNFLYQKNYASPTESSKLKRVHRPQCHHHFSIGNIPFVVGKSISPSHNLGLNIQQVLSTIKVKQPAVPGISPLLIRKVSRGIRPVSTLFEYMNGQYPRPSKSFNVQTDNSESIVDMNRHNGSVNVSSSQAAFKQNIQKISCEPLYEEDEDSGSNCSITRIPAQSKPDPQPGIEEYKGYKICDSYQQKKSIKSKPVSVETNEDRMDEDYSHYPNNNKQMAKVFTALHDQFYNMILQKDKLKEQTEKRKDKGLAKEIAELEEAIQEKEQEITAVVDLYREVMSLKQQMKLLHQRNSFVCITSEMPKYSRFGLQNSHSQGVTADGICETPHPIRLAGLLKQIQAFQRQLSRA